MSLQVRLRHALDEQVFDLEPRTLERPILVGRSAEADLQVPSLTVASKHCILFVHEGRWMAQRLASAGATTVNNVPLHGAVALHTGDVISVGDQSDVATIEIDPAGALAGRSGSEAIEQIFGAAASTDDADRFAAASVPSSVPWPTGAIASTPAASGLPSAPPRKFRPTAANVTHAAYHEAPDDPDAVDWGSGSSSTLASTRRRVRKQTQSSSSTIAWIIIAVAVIGGATAYVIYQHPTAKPPAPVVVAAPEEHIRHHKSMFDVPGSGAGSTPAAPSTPRADATPSPDPASSPDAPPTPDAPATPAPSADASAAPQESADADWEQVQDSAELPDQGLTILKIDDFRRKHPGVHAKELVALEAEALDELWWKRLTQLFNRRDRLDKEIAQKTKDIREEPDATFKKQLSQEIVPLQAQRDRLVKEVLGEDMAYTSSTPPETNTKDGLAAARAARNAVAYTSWTKSVARYVRVHNGQPPWGGEE